MKCPCNEDVKIEKLYGMVVYKHDDGSSCKYLNKFYTYSIFASKGYKNTKSDRIKFAFVNTQDSIEDIKSELRTRDPHKLEKLLIKYSECYYWIGKQLYAEFGDVLIKNLEYLKIYNTSLTYKGNLSKEMIDIKKEKEMASLLSLNKLYSSKDTSSVIENMKDNYKRSFKKLGKAIRDLNK